MTLLWKNRRHTALPNLLYSGQKTNFVVHEDVVLCSEMMFDIIEHLFFVNVDQHASLYCGPQAGAFDLPRLKYGVAVGQNHNIAHRVQTSDDLKSLGIESISERIIDQK